MYIDEKLQSKHLLALSCARNQQVFVSNTLLLPIKAISCIAHYQQWILFASKISKYKAQNIQTFYQKNFCTDVINSNGASGIRA
jgi:hypothetical protein